ncbi:MAG: hypothetical protein Phog2KO_37140 [Phototrophicaceae bacterium]
MVKIFNWTNIKILILGSIIIGIFVSFQSVFAHGTVTSGETEIAQVATSTLITPVTNLSLTPTPNATATLIAFKPQQNADWTPIERNFDGVTMVLVPAGCFTMGNDSEAVYWDGNEWLQGVPDGGEQCFDEPFWIDKTEVTQADFERLEGQQNNSPEFEGANRPVERILWFEAHDFCELRGGRLPNEAEWEYVARGLDRLFFPWGNEWVANNAVSDRSSSEGTADVGNILAGVSWVGALDMSGNVGEWTSSIYTDYPYYRHEDAIGTRGELGHIIRGGSFLSLTSNLRSAHRKWVNPNLMTYFTSVGFRCARDYE